MMKNEKQEPGLFDSHAHLYDKRFDMDRERVIAEVLEKLDYVLIPSEDLETSRKAVALAERHDRLYAAVGIHPQVTKDATEDILKTIGDLAESHPKVRAIGEMGLDYYYLYTDKKTQQHWFGREIELAKDLDLPIIIHDRDAHGDTLAILKEHKGGNLRGILHCFSGSYETAEELMKLGFYISFAGPVVFPKSVKLKAVAQKIPLDRLLIETDSPYLTPPPHRGERNTPLNVRYVAEEIARLKGLPVKDIIAATERNALDVYGIGR